MVFANLILLVCEVELTILGGGCGSEVYYHCFGEFVEVSEVSVVFESESEE